MDVFPQTLSECLVPITHLGDWTLFESLMHQGRIQAFITYMEPTTQRIFHLQVQDWVQNPLYVDNFKRVIKECKKLNFFDPARVRWERASRKLKRNPMHSKKTSDQRMSFKLDNMMLVKQHFTFGLWEVGEQVGHVYQTAEVPLLIYELTPDSVQHQPAPRLARRGFVYQDEFFYKRFVLRPHSVYVVPPKCRYLLLTVQKTLFSVDVMNWEDVAGLPDFRTHRDYTQEVYCNLPPPTPVHEWEEGTRMIRPKDRMGKPKATRKRRLEEDKRKGHAFVKPPPPVATPPPPPPPPAPQAIPLSDQPDVLLFSEPSTSSFNWEEFMATPVSKKDITQFIDQFEEELAMESSRPALPSMLPPPPDQYWEANQTVPVIPTEGQVPMDLCTYRPVGDRRRQHGFQILEPINLCTRTLVN